MSTRTKPVARAQDGEGYVEIFLPAQPRLWLVREVQHDLHQPRQHWPATAKQSLLPLLPPSGHLQQKLATMAAIVQVCTLPADTGKCKLVVCNIQLLRIYLITLKGSAGRQ